MKKIYRLKLQRDFDNVFKNGRNATADGLTLKYAKSELKHCRLSEIISKKAAKSAVQRNLLRRRLKEIIRMEHLGKLSNWDMVIIVRPELLKKNFTELKEIVRLVLEKAKLI